MRSYQNDKNTFRDENFNDCNYNNNNTRTNNTSTVIKTLHKLRPNNTSHSTEKNSIQDELPIKTPLKKSKEKIIVQQINLLTKKIERSSLSDQSKDLDPRGNYHKEFLIELNEEIESDLAMIGRSERINRRKFNIVQRGDNYIKISLIKSNVDLRVVSTEFYIGEKGLPCSQKTYGREYISFGRQQIDEQHKRPNDIMLFPTDPSISRSHLKVFYRKVFSDMRDYNQKERLLLQLNLPIEFIENILEYLKPKMSVTLEDNETIYGTYVKAKPLELMNLLINLYLEVKELKSIEANDNQRIRRRSFYLEETIINYFNDSHFIALDDSMFHLIIGYLKHGMFEELERELILFISKLYPEQFLDSFSLEVKPPNVLLKDNNLVLKENMVFLTSPRNGLIVRFICSLPEMFERFNMNYKAIANEFSIIKIFSYDPIFKEQQYDHECCLFKLILQSNCVISNGNVTPIISCLDYLNEYNALLCIETLGDPCGIMNRQTSLMFIQRKTNHYRTNAKDNSFSFNLSQTFLLGRNMKKSYMINIENDIMIYYSALGSSSGSWMITDLTPFLNPDIFESEDYFGLWLCSSPDKAFKDRFQRTQYEIGDNDQVKLSESVLKFAFFLK